MNDRILSPTINDVKVKESTFKVEVKRRLMKPDYVTIGGRIREARKNAGLTQVELAELLELSQPAINTIESGIVKLTLDNLFMISEALGQPVEYFLGVGSGELAADEVKWLQLFRSVSEDVRATLFDLVQGYTDRLRRKGL